MKMAIVIQCHTNSRQINSIIDYFDANLIDIYIHVDKKSNIFGEIKQKSNVYMIEDRIDVKWGDFSQVKATLIAFRCIRKSNIKYNYVHLISGQDYPIKNNDEFRNFFKDNHTEFIEATSLPASFLSKNGVDRYKVYYPSWIIDRPTNIFKRILRIIYREFVLITKIFERQNELVDKIYYGSQWFSITFECMNYILEKVERDLNLTQFFNNSIYSDEMFFQTIILNSPFAKNVVSKNLRYIDWSEKKASPKTLTCEDIKSILQTDNFFARKIDDKSVIDFINNKLKSC